MSQTTRVSAATLARRLGPEPPGRDQPAYRMLADRIRAAVLDGRLALGTGLPSERDLSAGLGVSRTTVNAAYAQLRDQGWLISRRGSGSVVRLPPDPDGPRSPAGPGRPAGPGGGTAYAAGGIFGWRDGVGWKDWAEVAPDMIDLTTACLPAPSTLPAAVGRAGEQLARHLTSDGYQPFGLSELREVVADRYTAAGVPTSVEQILITSGAQHAFTLVLDTLSAPADRVAIECPTYPVALDAVRHRRRTPVPIGLGEPPQPIWDTDLLAATLRQSAVRLAYLIPDFQNPTGALMDSTTREAVVAAARPVKTLVLADESFRDVPFTGDPDELPPPMAAFDTGTGAAAGATVLSLGSVSKSFWGGLRVGWIRAAPGLIQRMAATRALGDMAGPVLDQLVVTTLLADPAAALTEQRARLATGAATLQQALATHLPDWVPLPPAGGTSVWVRLPGPFATDLALLAPTVGVRIAPGPRFGPDGTMESFLRLPFTAPPEHLVTAVRRLASIADRAAAGTRTGLPGWVA